MTQPQPDINIVTSTPDSIPGAHHFSHEAMATTFEIFILNDDARYTQQAAWAAFDELDRLEAELSRFIENSDISRISNLAANQSLRIGPESISADWAGCIRMPAALHTDL
ncbi:MAG: hypothetical protein ACYS0C_03020 [Planctomycetota bacterium]|jgi:thiamine biosynthesis lipoprotein